MIRWSELSNTPLPDDWKLVVLEDVCDGVFDCPHSTPKIVDEGYHLVRTPDIITGKLDLSNTYKVPLSTYKERVKRAVPESGDLLFSREGTYFGIAATIPENVKLCLGQRMVLLKPNSNYYPDFIKYWINSPIIKQYLHISREGSVAERLNMSTIRQIPVATPPLQTQKAIASVLASLDEKIDLLYRQNKTLEAMAETLFRQWFIEEAEDDWASGVIPNEFDFTMGLSPPGTSYNEELIGTPLFQGNADFTFRFPQNRVFTTEPKRFAEKFDTLISVRAPVGAQNMAHEKCCIGRGVAAFRYKKNPTYMTYCYYKLMSLMDEIKQFDDTGTVFGSINKKDFQEFPIIIPPDDMVEKFENCASPINHRIIGNCLQIQTLEKLRDTLLPKLMSGEVRVNYEQDN